MQSNDLNSTATEVDVAVNDLGPLAWVLDELRKSLDGSAKALKRFVRDAELARGSDLAALDASQLRIARQQLHQAVGALEMVGLGAPALLLRSMEAAVQKFIQRPDLCSQDAAAKVELASFALTEYLEGVLADKPVSAVSLFPQYRDVQGLVGADRIHPADLWAFDLRWIEPVTDLTVQARPYDDASRQVLDQLVLKIMRTGDAQAAQGFRDMCLGFARAQSGGEPRVFWKIAAAYFEAMSQGLLKVDIYVKRAASRILLQYAAFAKGSTNASDRLAQDLLFFCSQAVPGRASDAPVLSAVRASYGLARFKPVDYEAVQFGRFDPALLAQARKRIVSAKETWSSLTAGDVGKFKTVADQFSLVTDSLVKLHPPSEPLAQALSRVIDTTVRSGQAPPIELALEVATAVLYLEAAFDDLDPNDPQLTARTARLAERLEGVRSGGEAQPLEAWMEELYRHVSDKQTMGSVVGELRISLSELEKSLDLFFRNPQEKAVLAAVPGQLSQMRGVLSVHGLDQASHAVLRMRDSVEQMLVTEVDEQLARSAGTFDQLGNNLGALSFLIDMLNYQPALAKKLFVYDEAKGELKPLMGRSQAAPDAAAPVSMHAELSQEVLSVVHDAQAGLAAATLSDKLDVLATHAALADQPALAETARNAAAAVASNTQANSSSLTDLVAAAAPAPAPVVAATASEDFEEDDLRDIFLEEAREVAGQAQAALAALAVEPGDNGELTILRRAFHTLKGSSRMVGLNEFGEAAWSMEQLLNGWLAEQKSSDDSFRALCVQAMEGFAAWIDDIAANRDAAWKAAPFRSSADAMRTEGLFVAIALPQAAASVPVPGDAPVQAEPAPSVTGTDFDFDFSMDAPPATALTSAGLEQPAEIQGIDFDSLSALSIDPAVAVQAAPAAVFELDLEEPAPAVADANPVELSDIDFDAHFLAPATADDAASATADTPAPAVADSVQAFAEDAPLESAAAPEEIELPVTFEDFSESATLESVGDEQVKVIGSLRIGIPLYNVYLNEADEWSRRLVTEVTEWTMEHGQPIGDSTLALTHSLAGSSSTVGFDALSEMARALEHALQQSQIQPGNSGFRHGPLFINAAEDIRRLLHQFAAGFLKQPDPKILQALRDIDFSEPVSDPAPPAAAAPPVAPPSATKFIIKAVTSAPVRVSAAPA
ncbi:MAG: Hpt domain-containing protein, partial [Polaromonas sp.]|uniref:Hpt domain-containing protein n=1 Tax=Polaromonas sp. TaxID=1869339 RepID=UPI004035C0F9